ncbi:MAG: metal ABC transporter substrate-binding protein [Acidimicrobiia bacterium]|nr:metal ABC transporter substrate-binding protein [Acidimicrobiia bacterium]
MIRKFTLLVALTLMGSACSGSDQGNGGLPLVIVTTTILGDIVSATSGGAVQIEVLMPVGADPHDFAASARQAARLREAVLVIANGVGLEEGLLDVIEAAEADGVAVMRIGELLDPQPAVIGEGASESGQEPHDLDPHVWLDPVRMTRAVELIAGRLSTEADVDVTNSAAVYRASIQDLHTEVAAMIEEVPPERRKLVTNHYSFGYFADRYGLTMLGAVIPATTSGAEPSASDFAALIHLLEREEVSVVFGSTTEPTTLAEALAEELGREVRVVELYTGSLGAAGSGADTYLDMMRTNARLIAENL